MLSEVTRYIKCRVRYTTLLLGGLSRSEQNGSEITSALLKGTLPPSKMLLKQLNCARLYRLDDQEHGSGIYFSLNIGGLKISIRDLTFKVKYF